MHGMMSSFKSDMLTAFSWNNIKRILLPWFGNELSMRWQMYCMSPLSKSRSWALIYIKIPLIAWNVYCVIDNFAEGEKERVHSTFFWSSQSKLFSTLWSSSIQVSEVGFQSVITTKETSKLWLEFIPHLSHL